MTWYSFCVMAQGKKWKKDEVFKILEPIFKLGCNVTKACAYAGIPRTTVQTWIEEDAELRLQVDAWQNEPNQLARKNWAKKLREGDFDASKEWIKRKEKDEFSDRQEHTGADGESLQITLVNYAHNDSPQLPTEELPT